MIGVIVFMSFFVQFLVFTKSDYISKTKNRTKKIIYAKTERQINSNLPCKFGQF